VTAVVRVEATGAPPVHRVLVVPPGEEEATRGIAADRLRDLAAATGRPPGLPPAPEPERRPGRDPAHLPFLLAALLRVPVDVAARRLGR
jgi:hypothetical protein